MQNVSVEVGVRQIRTVQRVFRSRTDVGIFYLIILQCTARDTSFQIFDT